MKSLRTCLALTVASALGLCGLLFVAALLSPNPAPVPTVPALSRTSQGTEAANRANSTNTAYVLTAVPSALAPSPTDQPPTPTTVAALPPESSTATATIAEYSGLAARAKTGGCVSAGGLPDPACTPGAVFEGAAAGQICVVGYSKSVRDVPDSVKAQAYSEYGITSHAAGQYEVDHLISLELGGSNDLANLWPEPADPRPGFHEKDTVENYLHDQVCSGGMALRDAQIGIAENWLQFYQPQSPAKTPTFVPIVAPTPKPTTGGGSVRVGAVCKDGTRSTATGSGACSHHGGVAYWLYQ